MAEPRVPVNDFERWIAGSRVPPDEREPDDLCDGIAAAVRSRDFEAVKGLMFLLAIKDPRKAGLIYDAITALAQGDERRAVLLAMLGG